MKMFRTAAKTSLAYASHMRRLSTGASGRGFNKQFSEKFKSVGDVGKKFSEQFFRSFEEAKQFGYKETGLKLGNVLFGEEFSRSVSLTSGCIFLGGYVTHKVVTKWFGKQTDRNLLEEILHIVKGKLEMDERKRKIDEMVYGLMNLMGHVMIENITTKLETKAEVLKKMEELVKELEIQEDDPPEVYQWKNRILAQLWKTEVVVSRM